MPGFLHVALGGGCGMRSAVVAGAHQAGRAGARWAAAEGLVGTVLPARGQARITVP